jgi:hypothetical protein
MINEMDEKRLNELLEGLGKQPVPEVPRNLSDRVWRTIRQRSDQKSRIPAFWPGWLLRPQFAIGLLIASAGLGVLVIPMLSVSAAERNERVRQALHLEIFGADTLGAPQRILKTES